MTVSIPIMKPWLGEAEVEAAADAIRSGWVAQGPRVTEFEAAFAAYVGASDGVAVSSCTAGLHLVLHALGIGPGDEVVVPSLSFIATANAPRYVGATPVFADVDVVSQNVTPETVAAAMTDRTKAVLAVHQVGMPLDLAGLRSLCDARGVALVEDAACAGGSTYQGEPVGHAPALAVFSFHPRKLLTTGEGGMVTTDRSDLAERMRQLRQHGMSVNAFVRHQDKGPVVEEYLEMGFNFRMTDIQAAVGLVQLQKLDAMVERRRDLADAYRSALEGTDGLTLPEDPVFGTTNYQSYTVVVSDQFGVSRDELMEVLAVEGISTRRGIMAAHTEPAFAGFPAPVLPNTDYLLDHSIILPLFHEMTSDELARVVSAIRSVA